MEDNFKINQSVYNLVYNDGNFWYTDENGCSTQININRDIDNKIYNAQNQLTYEIQEIKNKLLSMNMNKTVKLIHNCANCGATLNIEENKPVFHCKYCGSAYLIGTTQLYSNY